MTILVGFLGGGLVESTSGEPLMLVADVTAVVSYLTDGSILIRPSGIAIPKLNEQLKARMARSTTRRVTGKKR